MRTSIAHRTNWIPYDAAMCSTGMRTRWSCASHILPKLGTPSVEPLAGNATVPGMPIRVVTLDWGDTLAANHGQPYSFAHRRALDTLATELRQQGAELAEDWVDRCEHELTTAWVSSASPESNPENREFDMLGLFASWSDSFRTALEQAQLDAAFDRFSATCIDTVCAYDGVGAALVELRDQGLRLGILSHIPWHRSACEGWLRRRGWLEHFDFLSLSSEVGWIKPHPAHYQHAIAAAGCPAPEILHVGDHPQRDVIGGKATGFRTCLRWTDGIYPPKVLRACGADHIIAHVGELPDLVASINAD